LNKNTGAFELNIDLKNISAEVLGFKLFNSNGEYVDFCLNEIEKKFSMDRTKSGITSFSKEFPAITSAPIEKSGNFSLHIFVDKASIECFGNGGKFAMTNLVFPNEPYNRISFYTKGGTYNVNSFTTYNLNINNK
jgi:Beta-fructosidases (levanase/invertase)